MNARTLRFLETTILTKAELSAQTGIPEATLQKGAQRGAIPSVKKGRTLLFDVRDFHNRRLFHGLRDLDKRLDKRA